MNAIKNPLLSKDDESQNDHDSQTRTPKDVPFLLCQASPPRNKSNFFSRGGVDSSTISIFKNSLYNNRMQYIFRPFGVDNRFFRKGSGQSQTIVGLSLVAIFQE